MSRMNVSLPDALKAHVETGRYASASDYVRELICRDQNRAGKLAAMQAQPSFCLPPGLLRAGFALGRNGGQRVCGILRFPGPRALRSGFFRSCAFTAFEAMSSSTTLRPTLF